MKLKRILLILGLILTLPINIKAITADFTCDDNKLYVDSTFSCKLFVNPEDSLITSFKTDLSYPKEDFLLESISGYNNWYPLSSTTIDLSMQTSTGNEGIIEKTQVAVLKFKVKNTTSYGIKQIKLSGKDLSTEVSSSIKIISKNNKLSSLAVIGEEIKFDPDINTYELKTTKESVEIKATLADNYAKYVENYGPRTVSLNYGEQLINIVVVSESNERNTYTLKVNRIDNRSTNDNLSNIVLSYGNLSPAFSKDILNYNVEVPNNVESLTITATLEDKKAEFVAGYGSRTVNLNLGENIVLIRSQAEKGNTKTYTIKINRDYKGSNNYLKNISLSKGSINFDKDVFEYKVNVDYNTNEMFVSAIAEESTSTVEVIGNKDLIVGENIYLIKVVAENKSERIYKVIVNRLEEGIVLSNNNYLANLSIKGHSIAFIKDKQEYNITLTNEKSLDIKYKVEDEKSFVKIEGNENLQNNSVIKIIVTSEDGSIRTYKLTILKETSFNYINIILPLIILLMIIIIVIIVIIKKKNKNKDVNPKNEEIFKDKKLILNDKNEEPKKIKVKYKSLDDTLIVKDK